MSCDYAVWHTHKLLTNAQAVLLYEALCDGDTAGVAPSPAIDAFYAELTALHPEIDDLTDEEVDNRDLSPWSAAIDRSPGHLILSCVWSKADQVGELLLQLSSKHGLALFDPQSEQIVYPDEPDHPVWKRFWYALKEEMAKQREPWYVDVMIGLLFLLIAWFNYADLAVFERGGGHRFGGLLYKFGGPGAVMGVPAAIGAGLLYFGFRSLARSRKTRRN